MRKFYTTLCRVGCLTLLPASAHAWGLSSELNESWATARLVFPTLREHELRYCIKNEVPARFPDASLATQTEAALRLWLDQVRDLTGVVTIKRVPCDGGNFHILLLMGEETQWKGLGSYQLSSWDDAHYYSLVKFDTGFRYNAGPGHDVAITDFLRYAPAGANPPEFLRRISSVRPETVPAFSASRKLDESEVFWSTFPSLLHELGHSFGLCDTYDATVKDQCDPKFSSDAHPSSVMKDSNYLYLTADDITAIRALFKRFK
jgi:hypothetical protein